MVRRDVSIVASSRFARHAGMKHPLDRLRIETLKDVADRGMGGRTLPLQAEGGVQPATVHLDEGFGLSESAAGDHGED